MGIFVDALREETEEFLDNTGFDGGSVATPDNKYEVELNDVAKAVEDINQNYADQSSQEELDGQDLEANPVEECMIAIYESEHNWNMIMNTLAAKEVNESAMGREMVLESVDIKGFFEKIKQFFITMWKKITAVVKNWIDNAMAVLKTNKQFAAKYGKKLTEGKTAYFADSAHKAFKGYEFKHIDEKTLIDSMKDVDTKNDRALTILRNVIKLGGANNATLSGDTSEYSNDMIRALFLGEKNKQVTSDGFSKALKEYYYGTEDKITLPEKSSALDPDNITSILSGDMKMKNVRNAYNTMKKSINDTLKSINELEKSIKENSKNNATEATSAQITAISKWASVVKERKSIAHMAMTTYMRAAHAQAAQARRIGNAYIFALNKKTRKGKIDAANGKATHESAGFFSSLELI